METPPENREPERAIEITPAMVEAGVKAAREWLNRPENYLALEAGADGDLESLVKAVSCRMRSASRACRGE